MSDFSYHKYSMNYTIQENIEISAYEAVLTFDEDIRQYAIDHMSFDHKFKEIMAGL